MKLLVIRFSSIGDIVLTSPVVRCLKSQLNAEIHFLTKENFVPILTHNPYIDKIYTYQKNTISELEIEGYDAIIDLHKSRLSTYIKYSLGIQTYSFDKLNIKKWLYVNFKINKLPTIHLVDRYFEGLKSLGVINDGKGLDFFYDPEPISYENYNVIVLGAAHFTKRIPTELVKKIIKTNEKYILLGGNDVKEQGEVISKIYDNVIDLTGKTSLNTSANILNHAKHIFTGDTGLMHIAAALKKEITVFWGNTTPAFGMYPYYGSAHINWHSYEVNLPCRPCSKIGFDQCPKVHFKCMLDHSL